MRRAAFLIVITILTAVSFSCKEKPPTPETPALGDDLVAAENSSEAVPDYLYVTAPSGLTLRQFNNLNSEKLAVMPYGTKVKVLAPELNNTMTVGGIKGGMHEVEFNHKSGYAFNGYLSKFFPPEKDIKAKMYIEDLQKMHPAASYNETTGGSASNPSNTQTVMLPTRNWHDGFYIAQKLYRIPSAFSFPNPKGNDKEVISAAEKTSTLWISELHIERAENELQKITYSYAGEGYATNIIITKEGDMIKIEEHTVAD